MAEEIAHYKTVEGDILNLSIVLNRKYESLGRKWSYRKLMPQKDLEKFIKANETVHRYDLAEEFGIPDDVVDEAILMYRIEGCI